MQQARLAGGVGLAIDQGFIDSGPDRGRSPLRVTADGFVTFGAFPGVTLRSGGVLAEHDGGHYGFDRAVTRLTYDDFDSAIRYAAGELTPRITGFQGSNTILGIAVARDYQGIRPFENIRPSGRGGVTLDRPSTIIVETNGVETRRLRLDPGRYQLTDLSSQFGANDVRLIVEDDLGRHEVASAAFFTATAMLAGGLTDFGAALGRQENGERRYGGPMTATGYIRHGFANRFTLGTGGQYADSNWQVSGEGVVGTPIGLFRGQASTSRFDGKQGTAFSIDWLQTLTLDRDTWNFTVLSSRYSKDFSLALRSRRTDQRRALAYRCPCRLATRQLRSRRDRKLRQHAQQHRTAGPRPERLSHARSLRLDGHPRYRAQPAGRLASARPARPVDAHRATRYNRSTSRHPPEYWGDRGQPESDRPGR
nr:fimbria/pilus outer membrane usher protein [Sphingomonas sp. H160509]